MKILGVHDGHNAAAALVVDGQIVAAVQEERFNREKNWSGFPSRSIEWVLQYGGLSPSDLDFVAMDGEHMPNPKDREALLHEYRESGSLATRVRRAARATPPVRKAYVARRRAGRLGQATEIGVPEERVRFVEHHTAHAAAAYHGWGRYDEPVLVLTNDGAGDGLCATASIGRDGKLERFASVPESESIGNVYAVSTFMLGMVPLEHEYKLMGLAPYAPQKASEAVAAELDSLMRFDGGDGTTWRRTGGVPPTYYSYRYFRRKLELKRFDAICAGLQLWTEKMLVEWVRNCIRKTGIKKLALSGGTFMNVKVNKLIMELPEVEDLFVFPSCGDETNSMGAAYWLEAHERGDGRHIPPLRDVYLGPEFGEREVERALSNGSASGGLEVQKPDDLAREVARLLGEGEVVARFGGRAEFGARALGNRSILADASRPDVVRVINDMIKSRDFWMPFAPAILEERQDDYIINPKRVSAPYMILSFDTTERRGEIKSAVHAYDFTARPQVVMKDWNPGFHRILEAFELVTGWGGLLNTSFNLHGYPIVNSPEDALGVLENSDLRHLVVEPFLVSKVREDVARQAA